MLGFIDRYIKNFYNTVSHEQYGGDGNDDDTTVSAPILQIRRQTNNLNEFVKHINDVVKDIDLENEDIDCEYVDYTILKLNEQKLKDNIDSYLKEKISMNDNENIINGFVENYQQLEKFELNGYYMSYIPQHLKHPGNNEYSRCMMMCAPWMYPIIYDKRKIIERKHKRNYKPWYEEIYKTQYELISDIDMNVLYANSVMNNYEKLYSSQFDAVNFDGLLKNVMLINDPNSFQTYESGECRETKLYDVRRMIDVTRYNDVLFGDSSRVYSNSNMKLVTELKYMNNSVTKCKYIQQHGYMTNIVGFIKHPNVHDKSKYMNYLLKLKYTDIYDDEIVVNDMNEDTEIDNTKIYKYVIDKDANEDSMHKYEKIIKKLVPNMKSIMKIHEQDIKKMTNLGQFIELFDMYGYNILNENIKYYDMIFENLKKNIENYEMINYMDISSRKIDDERRRLRLLRIKNLTWIGTNLLQHSISDRRMYGVHIVKKLGEFNRDIEDFNKMKYSYDEGNFIFYDLINKEFVEYHKKIDATGNDVLINKIIENIDNLVNNTQDFINKKPYVRTNDGMYYHIYHLQNTYLTQKIYTLLKNEPLIFTKKDTDLKYDFQKFTQSLTQFCNLDTYIDVTNIDLYDEIINNIDLLFPIISNDYDIENEIKHSNDMLKKQIKPITFVTDIPIIRANYFDNLSRTLLNTTSNHNEYVERFIHELTNTCDIKYNQYVYRQTGETYCTHNIAKLRNEKLEEFKMEKDGRIFCQYCGVEIGIVYDTYERNEDGEAIHAFEDAKYALNSYIKHESQNVVITYDSVYQKVGDIVGKYSDLVHHALSVINFALLNMNGLSFIISTIELFFNVYIEHITKSQSILIDFKTYEKSTQDIEFKNLYVFNYRRDIEVFKIMKYISIKYRKESIDATNILSAIYDFKLNKNYMKRYHWLYDGTLYKVSSSSHSVKNITKALNKIMYYRPNNTIVPDFKTSMTFENIVSQFLKNVSEKRHRKISTTHSDEKIVENNIIKQINDVVTKISNALRIQNDTINEHNISNFKRKNYHNYAQYHNSMLFNLYKLILRDKTSLFGDVINIDDFIGNFIKRYENKVFNFGEIKSTIREIINSGLLHQPFITVSNSGIVDGKRIDMRPIVSDMRHLGIGYNTSFVLNNLIMNTESATQRMYVKRNYKKRLPQTNDAVININTNDPILNRFMEYLNNMLNLNIDLNHNEIKDFEMRKMLDSDSLCFDESNISLENYKNDINYSHKLEHYKQHAYNLYYMILNNNRIINIINKYIETKSQSAASDEYNDLLNDVGKIVGTDAKNEILGIANKIDIHYIRLTHQIYDEINFYTKVDDVIDIITILKNVFKQQISKIVNNTSLIKYIGYLFMKQIDIIGYTHKEYEDILRTRLNKILMEYRSKKIESLRKDAKIREELVNAGIIRKFGDDDLTGIYENEIETVEIENVIDEQFEYGYDDDYDNEDDENDANDGDLLEEL